MKTKQKKTRTNQKIMRRYVNVTQPTDERTGGRTCGRLVGQKNEKSIRHTHTHRYTYTHTHSHTRTMPEPEHHIQRLAHMLSHTQSTYPKHKYSKWNILFSAYFFFDIISVGHYTIWLLSTERNLYARTS